MKASSQARSSARVAGALALLLAVGCGESTSRPRGDDGNEPGRRGLRRDGGAPASSKRGVQGLPEGPFAIVVDDSPMEFPYAWVTSDGGRAFRLVLGNMPIECKDVTKSSWSVREGEKRIQLRFSPWVLPSGALDWHLVEVVADAFSESTDKGRADVEVVDASVDGITKVRFALERGPRPAARPGFESPLRDSTFRGGGLVTAKGCGVYRASDVAPRPQPLVATVGAENVPIQGATIRRQNGRLELRLQNLPLDCKDSGRPGDLAVEIDLEVDGKTVVGSSVRGDLLRVQGGVASRSLPNYRVEMLAPFVGSGEPLDAEIHGTVDVAGVPVKLEGRVSAIQCGDR